MRQVLNIHEFDIKQIKQMPLQFSLDKTIKKYKTFYQDDLNLIKKQLIIANSNLTNISFYEFLLNELQDQ